MEIYTDASIATLSNGIKQGGIGIYFGNGDQRNISETIVYSNMTIQSLETDAVYRALQKMGKGKDITIYSDSQHAVDCITSLYEYLKSRQWKNAKNKPVTHSDIIQKSRKIIDDTKSAGRIIKLKHVYGHSGIPGNEAADRLAYEASTRTIKVSRVSSIISTIESNNIAIYTSSALPGVILEEDTIIMPKKKSGWLDNDDDLHVSSPVATYVDPIFNSKPATITEDYSDPDKFWAKSPPVDQDISVDNENLEEDIEESNSRDKSPIPEDSYISKPIASNYLFLVCIQCVDTIVIQYPSNHTMATETGIGIMSSSTLAITKCRQCITGDIEFNAHVNVKNETDKHERYISSLMISPKLIEGSGSHISANQISNKDTSLLLSGKSIRYIPVTLISKICNRQCKASSINTDTKEILPYLAIGFI